MEPVLSLVQGEMCAVEKQVLVFAFAWLAAITRCHCFLRQSVPTGKVGLCSLYHVNLGV